MRQVKLLKVSFPILSLLVMVLAIADQQQLIARADTGCSGRCPFRAGYVANSSTINTYDYVESTFTLPSSVNNSSNSGSKFSMSVGLGDDHLGSPNWASAGVDIQVEANGQIDQPTSFWSVTNGSNTHGIRNEILEEFAKKEKMCHLKGKKTRTFPVIRRHYE